MTKLITCLEGGHWSTGNLVITPLHLNDKDVVAPHSHTHGHNIFILEGEVRIKTKDPSCGCTRDEIFKAFSHCWIPAGVEHEAIAITDKAKAMCVFVKGEFDDAEIEKDNNGWGERGIFNIEKPENERFKPEN